MQNTYVVVTTNLQDFSNSVSVSVGTCMQWPLGASVSELSWESVRAPGPSGSSVWCQKDMVIACDHFSLSCGLETVLNGSGFIKNK